MLPRQRAPSLAKTALSGGGGAAGQGLRKDGTTAKGSIAYGVDVGNIPTLAEPTPIRKLLDAPNHFYIWSTMPDSQSQH